MSENALNGRSANGSDRRGHSLLLVTHVALRRGPRGLQIDDQTAAGLAQWCRHFDRVTYIGIDDVASGGSSSIHWVDLETYPAIERCTVIACPRAYRVLPMALNLPKVLRLLDGMIDNHRYLCFTIGGVVGDWPALAALVAILRGRRYAAWLDRVESFIVRNAKKDAPVSQRLLAAVAAPVMDTVTRFLVHRSAAALLQGRDTYDHYSRSASRAYCTYDTHTTVHDEISEGELEEKRSRIAAGEPLRILYAGRAAAMKGPIDWLSVMSMLKRSQVPFSATWIGDGPETAAMQDFIDERGLRGFVRLRGFESNRASLLQAMRSSDVLVFCHKTPESPRCLIEALVSGCPLVGYETAYPVGLVQELGGGIFGPQNDITALARLIGDLNEDRNRLAELINAAAASGRLYNEDSVYSLRAEAMKSANADEADQSSILRQWSVRTGPLENRHR